MVDSPTTPPEDEASSPGPRRSTYTPPPAGAQYSPDVTGAPRPEQATPTPEDDDPIADAIAQEYRRWVPLDRSEAPEPAGAEADSGMSTERAAEPAADSGSHAPAVSGWAPSFVTPAPDPIASPPTPGTGYRFSAPSASPLAGLASTQSPAPVPSPIPPPPQRISLTDDALVEAVDPDRATTDTGTLLDLFEQQLALREQEAEQLDQWEQQVRRSAGEDADELVARVRSAYTGVMDVIPPAPAPGDVDSADAVDSAPTAPGSIVPPAVAPLPGVADPASLTGPDLDEALAHAPPPLGIQPTVATPPEDYAPPVPPPLVAPVVSDAPRPAHPLSGATELEALLAAAHAATGDSPVALHDEARSPFAPPVSPAQAPSPVASPNPAASPIPAPAAAAAAPASVAAVAPAPAPAAPVAPATAPASIDPAVPASTPIVLPVTRVAGPRATVVEPSSLEPTPAAQRAGRSLRLFWLWFSVSSSVVTVALGAVILSLGMSLRQAILATLIGVALSFLPLGLGTLAGKWSGQPTMVVSRATFGTVGNVVPAVLAVLTRLAWAAALLWVLATGAAEVLTGAGLSAGLDALTLTLLIGGVGLVLAAVVAGLGFGMLSIVSAVVAVTSALLVVGLLVLTVGAIDLEAALTRPDGSWILLLTGAVLVLSVVGLAWAQSSGDLARYQAKGTRGPSAVLFSSFGATLPAFVLVAWGALLAASDPALATSLAANPVAALAGLLPTWYPIPLLLAISLSLVAAAALALYSGGFALLSVGITAPRWVGALAVAVLTGALLTLAIVTVPDLRSLLRDALTTLAVPVAAWAGIFGAETMIRTRRVHSPSLLRHGGVYPAVRWVNLVMFLVASAAGWAFTSATTVGLTWQGYGWQLAGATEPVSTSDAGVLIALAVGLLTPLVAGIPALRALQAEEKRAAGADA